MTEDQLEQEPLGWLADVVYLPLNVRDIDNLDPRLISGQLQLPETSAQLMEALP